MSSKKHFSNQFFIKCFPVYSIYVHLTFLYIFGTKLSRENEKSHIFDEQMSKSRPSRLENMWGLHLVLEGGPVILSPNLILCSPTKCDKVPISYYAHLPNMFKSRSHTLLNLQN